MGKLKYYISRILFQKTRDRRRYLRKPLSLKVTNQQSGFFTYYNSTDISAGGMFLQTEEPPPIGTKLDLEFTLPLSSKPIRTSSEVVRIITASPDSQSYPGVGIRFRDISKEDREEIEKFINQPI